MNKENNIEWIKEKFAKGRDEVVKFTKISKLRIELVSEKRKMDEKLKNLGSKVYNLMKEGEIEIEPLDVDRDSIFKIDQNISSILSMIDSIKEKEKSLADDEYTEEYENSAEASETANAETAEDKNTESIEAPEQPQEEKREQ